MNLPIVVLQGITILPKTTVHFEVKSQSSIDAVDESMHGDQKVFMITGREGAEKLEMKSLYPIGVICKVKQIIKMGDSLVRVLIEAGERAELVSISNEEPIITGDVRLIEPYEEGELDSLQVDAYKRVLKDILRDFKRGDDRGSNLLFSRLMELDDISELCYAVTEYINLGYEKKQLVLSAIPIEEQLDTLIYLADNEKDIRKIKSQVIEKAKEHLSENQKEYVLREQMRAIREELGEENISDEAQEYLEKLKAMDIPDDTREHMEKEIKRFSNISSMSSESAVLRTYIETVLAYPFGVYNELSSDINKAIDILENDHYGLKKVKERVVNSLAVMMLSSDVKAPIICLVGPPGTGKTSIAKSIAKATGRTYERMSLGGVRDEAEIRGHRKTYVGAMPGRLVTAIKHSKCANPLILLDEIDKVSADYKGDVSSALLEVLDSEQNVSFMDHYMEVPIDLSKVLFIATANDVSMIPGPLRDRMEIIEVNSYTENEKLHIAKLFLVDKQIKKNGLKKKQFKIDEAAISKLIEAYTREAGVRELERTIGKLCQIAAKRIVSGEAKSLHVTEKKLRELLGIEKYRRDKEELLDKVGACTGLAWTQVGGDTLEIEVNVIDGRGVLKITGNLGDVMKESAEIALSHVRTLLSGDKKIGKTFFEKHDIHIHVPEGATPKDGPSAGITMTTAIYSALTGKKVRGDIAMTGEVTLKGKVLPIGGLKEKLLAARLAGKKEVLIPFANKPDVSEIDEEIYGKMKLTFVKTTTEVLKIACR